jgi:endonuclease G
MSTTEEQVRRLRAWRAEIAPVETELGGDEDRLTEEAALTPASDEAALVQESIIMRRLRPVLAIKNNNAALQFRDEAEALHWTDRLSNAMTHIERAAKAVGRIDLAAGPLDWVGTGWLLAENVLVTNRHVAREFARWDETGLVFSQGGGQAPAFADFLQEIDNPKRLRFELVQPLHIEDAPGPDVAFFEIAQISGGNSLAAHVTLAAQPRPTENAAVIGYPAYDSRIPEPELMEAIYGKIYNKKRIAPGAVTELEERRLLHNCTTLGGNSGSLVLDLDTGDALGLHYSGAFLTTNYAVRADILGELLEEVRSGRARARRRSQESQASTAAPPRGCQATQTADRQGGSRLVGEITLPLTIRVSLGELAAASPHRTIRVAPAAGSGEEDIEAEEGRAEDYRGRNGYQPGFLGVEVKLPEVERDASDVLKFQWDGREEKVLDYQNFSVVMSNSRRMCFFSAVNISGRLSRKSKRRPWRFDPRIPRERQIMKECYGDPPRFSRGHMTRREDPGWGDDQATADRGNADSMHLTNIAPQMQAFNSPICLALEDYALDNARSDKMDISVFTGPYFTPEDPTRYGVRIPLKFWKIIVFIHDQTGRLCATGYEMDQSATLAPDEEFVFGQFVSPQLGIATQVPVAAIARRSGISLGNLAKHDPLADAGEVSEGRGQARPLVAMSQIRFVVRAPPTAGRV